MAEADSTLGRFYAWQAPGKPVVVFLSLAVVDRLAQEAFHGLRALPRRGAEVGGILLGTAQRGEQAVVKIVDSVPVLCGHYFGPSYVLTQNEKQAFQQVLARWRPLPSRSVYAVGYYRSHTRDEFFLSDDDVWLMSTYFADPSRVALLVKPRITSPSVGGFFIWEGSRIQADSCYAEFPFDPAALGALAAVPATPAPPEPDAGASAPTPEAAPPALEQVGPAPEAVAPPPEEPPPAPEAIAPVLAEPPLAPEAAAEAPEEPPPVPEAAAAPEEPLPAPAAAHSEPEEPAPAATPSAAPPAPSFSESELEPVTLPSFLRPLPPRKPAETRRITKIPWLCILVGLALVLLGGFLGTQGASYLNLGLISSSRADAFALRLAVAEYGDNLHLTWDRSAPPLRQAQRAILIIGDGDQSRTLELNAAQLRSGSVIYRRVSGPVRFRLELYLKGNRSLSETWEPLALPATPQP